MKKVIIVLSFIVMLILLLFVGFRIKMNNKQEDFKFDISTFNINKRAKLVCENEVLIGNNEKELENNFFDIKLITQDKSLVIYLNKLWYTSYGTDYIQDDYLAEICREISKTLAIENIEHEYTLFKLLKENFNKVKQEKFEKNIQIEQFEIYLSNFDGMCKLEIKRK